MCKYSHDDAAVAPEQLQFPSPMAGQLPMPVGNVPFMSIFNGSMPFAMNSSVAQGAAYDPHEAHMDMRPGINQGRPVPARVSVVHRGQVATGADHDMRD